MGKFKKGAASFYIVAISTLILVIVAASFAAVIISEVTRTSNDDLAQSAYDSALAGVEDAKLAYYNYQSCKEGGASSSELSCAQIVNWVEGNEDESLAGKDPCDMVAMILGREEGEVLVQESTVGNDMQQAYTCVKVTNKTDNVEGTISETNPSFTVRVRFDEDDEVVDEANSVMNRITKMIVRWHSDTDGDINDSSVGADYDSASGGLFGDKKLTPAVISVGMAQTSKSFRLDDFEITKGDRTNRGTVYLVPFMEGEILEGDDNRYNVTNDNFVNAVDGMLKSNDKRTNNKPFAVECSEDSDYACFATVEIPRPVQSDGSEDIRNNETFVFRVALPYGGPATHFSLEFYCGDTDKCSEKVIESEGTDESLITGIGMTVEKEDSNQAILDGVQVKIDSTGRANDLYRRIETTLMPADTAMPYPLYAIQVLGTGKNSSLINKIPYTTCEYDFSPTCSR